MSEPITPNEARALRLATIFGAPSDPEPPEITSAMTKLKAIEQAGATTMTTDDARALRDALTWRRRYEDLEDAIDELFMWEPGRKGWAAAKRLFDRRHDQIGRSTDAEYDERDGHA